MAFVAAEPETFHHLGAHATAGYVKHMNGAVVPDDTASVKAAKGLHMAAKHNAAVNGYAMPYVYQPLVKPVAPVVKTVEVEAPKVVSYKAPEMKPITYTKPLVYAKPMVYTKPVVTQPLTYTVPAAHHVAAPVTTYTHPIATTYTTPYVYGAHHLIHKREAEADAESDAQMYYTNAYPTTYTTPYTYANAYTTPYTYASPMVYKTPLSKYHSILKYHL